MEIKFNEEMYKKKRLADVKKQLKVAKINNNLLLTEILLKELKYITR